MPFLSILIPTRNRPALARLSVEAAVAASDEDSEIVVADNGDVALELPVGDHRLRHLPPQGVLSMPDNWERALEAASGEWVMLLADKHMLVTGATALLRRLTLHGHAVVSYGYGVLRQSIAPHEVDDCGILRSGGGNLQWPADSTSVEGRESKADLADVYLRARYPARYPMLYTALVRRDILSSAKAKTGRFFHGLCPDVASAVQILAEAPTYLRTQIPAVLVQYPGSPALWSTGGSAEAGTEHARAYLASLRASGWRGDPIEHLLSGAIFETLRACAERRQELSRLAERGWKEFAKNASREIESLPLSRRLTLHKRLLAYTQRNKLRPGAALSQLQASLAAHLPRHWLGPLLDVRRRAFRGSPPEEAPAVLTSEVASRAEALGFLGALVTGASREREHRAPLSVRTGTEANK